MCLTLPLEWCWCKMGTSSPIRAEVQCHWTTTHCSREGNDCASVLFEDIEALTSWLKFHGLSKCDCKTSWMSSACAWPWSTSWARRIKLPMCSAERRSWQWCASSRAISSTRSRWGIAEDPAAWGLVKLAWESKMRRFWLNDELLYTMGNQLYVQLEEGVAQGMSQH